MERSKELRRVMALSLRLNSASQDSISWCNKDKQRQFDLQDPMNTIAMTQ